MLSSDVNGDIEYAPGRSTATTSNPSDTRILKFDITHEDPKLAKDFANTLAEVTAERVAYIMDTDEPKIVEEAVVPDKPSSPRVVMYTALGAMLGGMLSAGAILVLYLMKDTIQTEEDVKKYLGMNILAAVPKEKRK